MSRWHDQDFEGYVDDWFEENTAMADDTTIHGVQPGDIWEEVDGDFCFIVEPGESVDQGYDAFDCFVYYNESNPREWELPYEDGGSYYILRHRSSLRKLIYRQYDEAPIDAPGIAFEPPETYWITKDSGERHVTESGYQRDTQKGKPRFDLMWPKNIPYSEQMLTRLAMLLNRGAQKYDERNWEKANTQADLERFKGSAERHLHQWTNDEFDEDHAAAIMYNVLAHESTKWKMLNLNDEA